MLTPTWPLLGRSKRWKIPNLHQQCGAQGEAQHMGQHHPGSGWCKAGSTWYHLAFFQTLSVYIQYMNIHAHVHIYIYIYAYIWYDMIFVGKTKSQLAYEDYSTNPDLSLVSNCLLMFKWSCAILYAVDFRENRMTITGQQHVAISGSLPSNELSDVEKDPAMLWQIWTRVSPIKKKTPPASILESKPGNGKYMEILMHCLFFFNTLQHIHRWYSDSS